MVVRAAQYAMNMGGAAFIIGRPISPSSGEQKNNICWMFAFPSELKLNLDQAGLNARKDNNRDVVSVKRWTQFYLYNSIS